MPEQGLAYFLSGDLSGDVRGLLSSGEYYHTPIFSPSSCFKEKEEEKQFLMVLWKGTKHQLRRKSLGICPPFAWKSNVNYIQRRQDMYHCLSIRKTWMLSGDFPAQDLVKVNAKNIFLSLRFSQLQSSPNEQTKKKDIMQQATVISMGNRVGNNSSSQRSNEMALTSYAKSFFNQ